MHTEDAEGINLTHLSPPVRSWVYIGGLGKVMSKESAPPMLTCLSIHQQLWINRWIMGIVLWRLIHLIILHMLFLSLLVKGWMDRRSRKMHYPSGHLSYQLFPNFEMQVSVKLVTVSWDSSYHLQTFLFPTVGKKEKRKRKAEGKSCLLVRPFVTFVPSVSPCHSTGVSLRVRPGVQECGKEKFPAPTELTHELITS